MFDIRILGSISGRDRFSAERVAALLAAERAPLGFGREFVGRPVTHVFRDDGALAKLRTELDSAAPVMEKWGLKTLARERELGVHHPDKTWFLARRHADDRLLIGNVCPLLRPLSRLLAEPPADEIERARRLDWLRRLFEMYCDLGRTSGARLDEGLSNFGLDDCETLFYLDDDIYRWDEFETLPHVVGGWFRSHAWFDGEFGARLGTALRGLLDRSGESLHHAMMITERLRGLFMPQPDRRQALAAFAEALLNQPRRAGTRTSPTVPARSEARYLALFGDIHGNLAALEAVLAFLAGEGIRRGLVLGDLVGYGPHPCECVDRIAASEFVVIKGNHDHAAVTGHLAHGSSRMAQWSLDWTLTRLSEAHKGWLADLPLSLDGEGWLAVHGAPMDPTCINGYVYAMTYEDNLAHLRERGIPLCFHGHTHIPAVYAEQNDLRQACITGPEQDLTGYRHALVCPGSVGQPRNRQTGAQLAIWDRRDDKLQLLSLPYDIEATLRAMREAGFPESLWQRLLAGM